MYIVQTAITKRKVFLLENKNNEVIGSIYIVLIIIPIIFVNVHSNYINIS